MKQTLSIIIPIFNEQETILELYARLKVALTKDFPTFQYEIIFVDDGSTDDSFVIASGLKTNDVSIKVIQLSRNFGHHIAITAGIDYASGEYVVMMDCDLQDQPEQIVRMYHKLSEGYDVVYAERIDKKFSLTKRASSALFNGVIRLLVQERIVINSTIFRIMTKQVVDNIKSLRERNRYLVGIIGWVGFKHTSVQVPHGKRFAGESKYNFSKQVTLAINAITSFSDYPLRLASRLGLGLVMLSFLMTLYLIIRKILYATPIIGWTSLIVSIFLIGGMQIFILGIIGEYLGRNYIESKQRPLYVIKTII